MTEFPVHSIESAPAGSRKALEGLITELGIVPNLAASMAESPELLRGFLAVRDFMEKGSSRPGQVKVLALANAFENGCEYYMALHSTSRRFRDSGHGSEGRSPAGIFFYGDDIRHGAGYHTAGAPNRSVFRWIRIPPNTLDT